MINDVRNKRFRAASDALVQHGLTPVQLPVLPETEAVC